MRKNKYQYMRRSYKTFAIIADILGGVFFNFLRLFFKKKHLSENPRNIVVFRMDKLGDVVLSIPAIRGIKKSFSSSKVTLVLSGNAVDLFKYEKSINEIIPYDGFFNRYMTGEKRHNTVWKEVKKNIRFIIQLRRKKFDLAVVLRGDLPTNMLSFFSGSYRRVGFGNEGGYFFLTDIIPLSESRYHELERMEEVFRYFEKKIPPRNMQIETTEKEGELVNKLLSDRGINRNNSGYAVISPFTGFKWNSWQKKGFLEIAKRLRDKLGMAVIMTGTAQERGAINELVHSEKLIYNLAGKTSLLEVVALFKGAEIFVGNDSGPVHIAVSAGIPVVQLFGPGDVKRFAHEGAGREVIYKKTCFFHPCTVKTCKVPEKWCMAEISVDEVFEACLKVLDNDSIKT